MKMPGFPSDGDNRHSIYKYKYINNSSSSNEIKPTFVIKDFQIRWNVL